MSSIEATRRRPHRWSWLLAALTLLAAGAPAAGCSGRIGADPGPVVEACEVDGAVRYCYPGPPISQNIGACQDGTQSCAGGVWNACEGHVVPQGEGCDDGVDDDCNGLADDGCPCEPGSSQPCYTGPAASQGVGECQGGVQACEGGKWASSCEGQVTPAADSCDTLDNDCNGLADEGCDCVDGDTLGCYTGPAATNGVGVCHGGQQVCQGGKWSGGCEGEKTPSAESCNGKDDDCDGKTDEGDPGSGSSCDTGKAGICGAGTTSCQGGKLLCVQSKSPASKDDCDGLDNDCDGTVDEGVGESCNGKDDDCDGKIDEDISGSCTVGAAKGVCAAGVFQCSGGVQDCVPTTGPSSEVCDGLDNDCDGQKDESDPQLGQSCTASAPGICANGKKACVSGKIECAPGAPKTEVCNTKDDDCDGKTDENVLGYSCDTGQKGVCSAGTMICKSGLPYCKQNVSPSAEVCDNKDNDCDGTVDTFPCGSYKICVAGQCKAP